jgi:hypothetical protein
MGDRADVVFSDPDELATRTKHYRGSGLGAADLRSRLIPIAAVPVAHWDCGYRVDSEKCQAASRQRELVTGRRFAPNSLLEAQMTRFQQ